ncbi:unnamed protein product [Rotaria sp. Silwood2]|nr:unnamed protein product [Rotaria sp. Silwood2]CAF3336452.1 unnamed protein product [Rotaria sp. Silwood2]CAF4264344.1 unnamed protein product [Rotaria sp. Silwood2]CAF4541700.1 unnamed protein product [Rotaria sp. Silwood2]CAF4655411.1 unnamed protein product [Rotaria sp. Silwood2]
MEYSCIKLNDLPDEILMIILKKLHYIDVLYSLISVDKRLNAIASDSVFTKDLALMSTSSNDLSYEFTDPILDRFYLQILPKINYKIEWLNVESSSMQRILLPTNYPNLHGLGLYNLASNTARDLFTGKIFSLTLLMINHIRILK